MDKQLLQNFRKDPDVSESKDSIPGASASKDKLDSLMKKLVNRITNESLQQGIKIEQRVRFNIGEKAQIGVEGQDVTATDFQDIYELDLKKADQMIDQKLAEQDDKLDISDEENLLSRENINEKKTESKLDISDEDNFFGKEPDRTFTAVDVTL